MNEAELIARARDGDHGAFHELVSAHREAIYRAAYHILKNEEETLDVLQESLLKAFQALNSFEQKASFRTWARRIAVNRALNRLRDTRKHRAVASLPEGDLVADQSDLSPSQKVEKKELKSLVHKAIEGLSEDHAEAIRLHDIEGLTYAEIAERTGLKAGTIMSRIHYGRKHLKERLAILLRDRRATSGGRHA